MWLLQNICVHPPAPQTSLPVPQRGVRASRGEVVLLLEFPRSQQRGRRETKELRESA